MLVLCCRSSPELLRLFSNIEKKQTFFKIV
nr:MAG TPA: hypothetical protein [Caudoviricetes sp.]